MSRSEESGNILIGCLVLMAIILVIAVIVWLARNVGPYLLGGAALYGAGIALWNYGQAFTNNVKPGRPTP